MASVKERLERGIATSRSTGVLSLIIPADDARKILALLAAVKKAELVLRNLDTMRHLDPNFPPLDKLITTIAAMEADP